MKTVKVLHLVPGLASGGISSVILNYYRHMDRDKVKFDFAVFMPELGYAADEFRKMGSDITILPRKSESMSAYKEKLTKLIKEGNYDIVHAHQNYQSFIPLRYAKKCGVKVRIAHAHSTKIDQNNIVKRIIKYISYLGNSMYVTNYFACGKEAGKAMFGRRTSDAKSRLMKNAIDIEDYAFSKEIREKVRSSMDWSGKFVIGNVGRLSAEKNQLFLIDVFYEISKLRDDAVLYICGEGPDREKLERHIKEKLLQDKVFLPGNRNDVNELISGMDVFVLPSLFEGLPVTGVEALTNGIPCVFSDTVTREFDEYGKGVFVSLARPANEWAKIIVAEGQKEHDPKMAGLMKKSGYDIYDSAKGLTNFYLNRVLQIEKQ